MTTIGEPGVRAVISELGETPLEAVERFLRLVEQPAPAPEELGPTDVVIAVKSASVGWVDLLMASGQYQHVVEPPYTPGLEYSGVVAWCGPGIDPRQLTVGDRVMADGLLTGPRSKGAYRAYGGFATYAVAPAQAVRPLPERLSFDQGCSFLGNYETAYHCLIARGRLQPGETVLIHGASGSTGLAAVQVAKRVGATVIATGRSPEKLALVREQGADHVLCVVPGEAGGIAPFRDEVKALTEGQGVDVVYDGVGGDVSLESLRCARFGARFLVVGWASTPFVARGKGLRGAPRANQLPTNLIMMKGLDVLGCPTAISTHRDPGLRPQRLAQLMQWVEDGAVTPYVSGVFPLSQVAEAMRAKWENRFVGSCVVRPATSTTGSFP
jgi:NADPH:quinone reductase